MGCEPLWNIADSREIQRSWLDVQFFENRISPGVIVQLIHATGFVVQIAENNRTRWARLLASRLDIAVVNKTVTLGSAVDFAVLHTLDAVRALLHNTSTSHRYFRVQNQRLQLLRSLLAFVLPTVEISVLGVVIEVVEPPHFVGAVVRAVPSTDATVVSHRIDTFLGVNRRRNRANFLARCRLAMRTRHRLHDNFGIDWGVQIRQR